MPRNPRVFVEGGINIRTRRNKVNKVRKAG